MSQRIWVGVVAAFVLAACDPRPPAKSAPLFNDLGAHHHPITAASEKTQRYFDQGLRLSFAFNHAEALRSFKAAAELDPACAMCYWGQALVLGPNINAPMMPEAAPQADAAVRKAVELAGKASPPERDYFAALTKRYSADPKAERAALDQAYARAMREVAKKYPDDLDAAALYAEAHMDTTAWNYWQPDGRPRPGTDELLATLESVIARQADHALALHLYIHAIEASPYPERAERAADVLGELMPGAGHMVHMPAHIYARVGRYHDASLANERAADADESYITQCRAQGFYPAMYYPHNVHFLWYSATAEGRSQTALRAARKLVRLVTVEQARQYPLLEILMPAPQLSLVQFGRWDEVLTEPKPAAGLNYATAMWHYARGVALAAKAQPEQAQAEAVALARIYQENSWKPLEDWAIPAPQMLALAQEVLAAELAGRSGGHGEQVRHLRKAVQMQDALPYMEPPYWDYPLRQSLGKALLEAGKASEAEAVYRADLRHNRRNGWSLFGLEQSLRAQGKNAAADEVKRRFTTAWKAADVKLAASRF